MYYLEIVRALVVLYFVLYLLIIGKNSQTEQKSSKNLSQYEAATPSTEGSYSSKNSRPQSRALARDWRAENFYVIFAKSSRVLTIVSFCSMRVQYNFEI